jgi:hypothetical protein
MTGISEFLQGPELAKRIRRICSEDLVDCAVAFLGRGMRAELFPRTNQVVRIVCDIAMGCTSQKALMEFGAPTGPTRTRLDSYQGVSIRCGRRNRISEFIG